MVQLLIKHGADVNIKNDNDITLLMYVVDRLDVELVEIITQAGADVNATDGNGDKTLNRALSSNNIVKHILSENGHEKAKIILGNLLSAGASVHGEGDKSPMVSAVKFNSIEYVRLVVDNGGDVNSQDNELNTVLMLAAVTYNLDNEGILKLLIQKGACVNLKCPSGNTALMLALFNGREKAANILLEAQTDVNIRNLSGETAILLAVKHCSSSLVLALIDAGADFHAVTNIGNSGLVYCTTAAAAEIFIAAGVNVNIRNVRGRTPLHFQVVQANVNVTELLLSRGANVDEKDFHGDTPLILAYKKERDFKLIDLLISSGANVNVQNKKGKAALMYASSAYESRTYLRQVFDRVYAIQNLLERGAAVNIRDNLGFTAAMHACKRNRKIDLMYGSSAFAVKTYTHNVDVDVKIMYIKDYVKLESKIKACNINDRLIFRTVNTLLQHGAHLDVEDYLGRNILFYSFVSYGINNLTVNLLQQGGNPVLHEEHRQCLIDHNLYRLSRSINSENEMLRLFVCNGIFGSSLFKVGLFSKKGQIVKSVLAGVKCQQLKYIIANCFLTVVDFNFIRTINPLTPFGDSPTSMSPDENWSIEESSFSDESSVKAQLVSLLHKAAREPWPLVKLAFITVSTMMGDSPRREARIRKSVLPPRLQELLMFQTPVARLPVSEWDNIPLCFDPDVYETLPRPRPLMTFWPFGHLVV